MINQIKAHAHLWLDYTPADQTRTKVISALTARLDAAPVSAHVGHVLTEMIAELIDANGRIRELDITIKELVSP